MRMFTFILMLSFILGAQGEIPKVLREYEKRNGDGSIVINNLYEMVSDRVKQKERPVLQNPENNQLIEDFYVKNLSTETYENEIIYSTLSDKHDANYCLYKNNNIIIHDELERLLRVKGANCTFNEVTNKCLNYIRQNQIGLPTTVVFSRTFPNSCKSPYLDLVLKQNKSWLKQKFFQKVNKIVFVGHHCAHAADAFYSSTFDDALVLTIDGAGRDITLDGDFFGINTSLWYGNENNLKCIYYESKTVDPITTVSKISPDFRETILNGKFVGNNTSLCHEDEDSLQCHDDEGKTVEPITTASKSPYHFVSLGFFYYSLTRKIAKIEGQFKEGTAMALSSFANPDDKITYIFNQFLDHPDLSNLWLIVLKKLSRWVGKNFQRKCLVMASGQSAFERKMKELLEIGMKKCPDTKNICLGGGAALNSKAAAKIKEWFPHIENVYIPPAPHDGGLSIGGALYYIHSILKKPKKNVYLSPYLGRVYSYDHIWKAIDDGLFAYGEGCYEVIENVDTGEIVDLLENQHIIAVFGGGSESGRRALGNRSILADPRNKNMKDRINSKVKHREWYRPFAPSVMREYVKDWFEQDIESPYMSFAPPIKEDKKDLIPAVCHVDGTARLQTVKEDDNKWYYHFLKLWNDKTNVPMILNTSFNDREPICETAKDAIRCFMKTDLCYLYFYDQKILLKKCRNEICDE